MLERALEASGDDLDSAIKSLNELRLESTDAILSSTGFKPENGQPATIHSSVEGFHFCTKCRYLVAIYSNSLDMARPVSSTFIYDFHQAKGLMRCVGFDSPCRACLSVLLSPVVGVLVS